MNEGDPGNSLYIIKKGEIGVYKGDKRVRILKEGELPTKPKTTRKPRAKKEVSNND